MLLQNGTTILLQNATNVYFLLQNATVLLHNATVITNYRYFIAKGDIYYKIRRLLQIATVQTVWMIPPPSTVVNNTGKAWGSSRTPLCIFMYIILYVYVVLCIFKKIR